MRMWCGQWRGQVSGIALCWLALQAGGCTSRREPMEPEPRPAAEPKPSEPPKPPEAVAPRPTETSPMAATLECMLSVAPSVAMGQPVEVRFQLTNHTSSPLYVLTWRTPLERVGGKDFEVTREGMAVAYRGPMKKRGNPQADQYVTLAPGASVDGKLDLALAYAMTQPGHYRIAFPGPLLDVADKASDVPRALDDFKSRPVQCPAVETTLTP